MHARELISDCLTNMFIIIFPWCFPHFHTFQHVHLFFPHFFLWGSCDTGSTEATNRPEEKASWRKRTIKRSRRWSMAMVMGYIIYVVYVYIMYICIHTYSYSWWCVHVCVCLLLNCCCVWLLFFIFVAYLCVSYLQLCIHIYIYIYIYTYTCNYVDS